MANDWIYRVKSNTLQKRLFAALENDTFTDVAFQVGSTENQRVFKAHRLVLGAENSELERIICRSDSGKIKIPDVHPIGFENLIRYCYGVGFHSPGDLLAIRETCRVAEKFRAPRLKLAAENNLLVLVKSKPVIELLQVSIELKMPRLKERCLEIISSRFEKVLMTEELISAPLRVMELILSLCPDHGREFKICALVTLLRWVKKHKCPEDIACRLLSMVQDENIAYEDVVSVFKTEIEQLTDNQLREVVKDLFSKEICPLKLSPFVESTDTVENAATVSPEGTVAKDEAEEMEQEPMLQEKAEEMEQEPMLQEKAEEMEQEPMLQEEAVIDEAKMLELKDEKEVTDLKEASELKSDKEVADLKEASELKSDKEVADLKETSELKNDKEVADLKEASELKNDKEVADLKEASELTGVKEVADLKEASELNGEKERYADDDYVDDPLVMKVIKDQLINNASKLIKNFLSDLSQKTESRMTEEANKAICDLSEKMEKAIDGMIDSFKKLYEATSEDEKAAITTTVLTESSSSIVGNEGEHKIEDI